MATQLLDGQEKSSRSKADLFEVMVAQKLIDHYKIDRDYSEIIKGLENRVKEFQNGEKRLDQQFRRLHIIVPKIIDFLNDAINKGNLVTDIEWIGRIHQKMESLSDVDASISNGDKIGISLKSVGTGMGTQKNLGLDTVKKYLKVDIEKDLETMWLNVRKELKSHSKKLKKISLLPKGKIKDLKRKFPIINEIGKKFGLPIQIKAVKMSVKNFNNLNIKGKRNFLKEIFGVEDNKRILNVIVQDSKDQFYWNEKYESLLNSKNIFAKVLKGKSYGIFVDSELMLRVQSSFTNGIGISAFCQRAFLVKI